MKFTKILFKRKMLKICNSYRFFFIYYRVSKIKIAEIIWKLGKIEKKVEKNKKNQKKLLTFPQAFVILLMHFEKRPKKALKKSVKKSKKVVDKSIAIVL